MIIIHRMERQVVDWAVVIFPTGGTATVRASWFNPEESTLLWPPKNVNVTKALRENMIPSNGWTTYEKVWVLITCGE